MRQLGGGHERHVTELAPEIVAVDRELLGGPVDGERQLVTHLPRIEPLIGHHGVACYRAHDQVS